MTSPLRFADLHLHTVFSDGTYTPEELVLHSQKAGLCAIAVSDHDTIAGIMPAMEAAKEGDTEVLPGLELTAEYEGLEVHILGYLIDHTRKELNEKLKALQGIRVERIYKIAEKLKAMGIDLDARSVFDLAKSGTVGRLHVARALVKAGKAGSIYEAFQKFIGDKCPAYVLGFRLTPQEAIKLIKDAGGIPVLAHPYSLNNDELIPRFAEYGIMGLEVYYPEHSQSLVNFYLRLAEKYNLLATGGSDCHGDAKPEVRVGSIKIPYELVDKLKEAKARIKK